MSFRIRVALVVLLVTSLSGLGAWGFAQTQPQVITPIVLSGNDIGFRVEGHRKDIRRDSSGRPESVDVAIGQVVVRINGQWVEAQVDGQGTVRRATN